MLKYPAFTQNIIARAEFRHQRYVIESSRSGRGWIILAVLMLLPALLMSIILFGVGLVGGNLYMFLNWDDSPFGQIAPLGIITFVTMNIALYLVVTFITVGLSANSITRERSNKTWDVLLLTRVDAQQLVLGKWWASLMSLWGDHLMVGLLRLGALGWVVAMYYNQLPQPPFGLPPGIVHMTALTLIMAAFTIIDAAFTAALGIAIPLSNFSGPVTTALVVGVRSALIVTGVFFAERVRRALVYQQPYVLVALAGLVLFALATWAALRWAQMTAVRGQVSEPGNV